MSTQPIKEIQRLKEIYRLERGVCQCAMWVQERYAICQCVLSYDSAKLNILIWSPGHYILNVVPRPLCTSYFEYGPQGISASLQRSTGVK